MKHYRYRCGGSPYSWPFRYAWATAWAESPPTGDRPECDEEGQSRRRSTWYAQREHARRRSRHAAHFGVRRPLRYLSYQLDLDEPQRRRIAAVLDRVKMQREQSALDEKKVSGKLADLIEKPEFDSDSVKETLSDRVESTQSLQKTIAEAISEIVGLLDPDQREELAYLIRTGAFRI